MFSPSSSTGVSDSLSSIQDSPTSPNQSSTDRSSDIDYISKSYDCFSEIDYNSKSYINELLESGLKEERFRIDRKKLEDMLQIEQSKTDNENAEDFFHKVMIETSTQISWPSKLKIGAKSKKDPHVKVIGKPEAVQMAKERILEVLDTKKNRVTLKMDVCHSAHSYTIGKGGFKIQQVMEETGCHIHFPDSNRNNTAEKSNQVSIAGQAAGVEQARAKIRELLPLVFTFELTNANINPGDECSPAVQHIQQTYSFNVAFRPIGPVELRRILLEVRGCQRLLSRLRQGLALLMEYLTGSKTVPVMGFMKTEIAAQHHQFVMGSGNINIQMIKNKTGATVIFPDPSTTFGSESPKPVPLIAGHCIVRSKSTVLIHGSFDSVCLAWQELLKCLPLVLMFDLKEGQELDPVMVNNFMEAFNINIMLRPKMKENTKSVLIRGAERDSRVLFQVRKDILVLEEDESCPSSPSFKQSSYRIPTIETFRLQEPGQNIEDQMKPGMTTEESLNFLSNIIQQNPQIVGLLNNLSSVLPSNGTDVTPQSVLSPAQRNAVFSNQASRHVSYNHLTRDVESWMNKSDRSYAYASGVNVSNYLQKDGCLPGDSEIFKSFNSKFGSRSDLSSSQPGSSASSTSSADNTVDFKSPARFLQRQQQLRDEDVHQLLADYENKKLCASKAMQQPAEGARTPNLLWSGFGFSKSMPDCNARNKFSRANSGSISEYLEDNQAGVITESTASSVWSADSSEKIDGHSEQTSPFASSNSWDTLLRKPNVNYSSFQTLEQLLRHLNLEQYWDIFAHHEIDLAEFLALNEIDLKQLNISYGVRRKMLIAISAIREQRMGDWSKRFRAAPGAERRTLFQRFSASSIADENSDRL